MQNCKSSTGVQLVCLVSAYLPEDLDCLLMRAVIGSSGAWGKGARLRCADQKTERRWLDVGAAGAWATLRRARTGAVTRVAGAAVPGLGFHAWTSTGTRPHQTPHHTGRTKKGSVAAWQRTDGMTNDVNKRESGMLLGLGLTLCQREANRGWFWPILSFKFSVFYSK
jgi:hypothetical protein